MKKTQSSETLNLATQILPFLLITATFIIIAYLYGHAVRSTIINHPIGTISMPPQTH